MCYETQEALFTAMVNCEQLAEDLEATTAELAEYQSRRRNEEQAHRDQVHALRATVRLRGGRTRAGCNKGDMDLVGARSILRRWRSRTR